MLVVFLRRPEVCETERISSTIKSHPSGFSVHLFNASVDKRVSVSRNRRELDPKIEELY